MQELNVNEEKVTEMENANAANEEFSCFYRCIALKGEIVSSLNRFSIFDFIF